MTTPLTRYELALEAFRAGEITEDELREIGQEAGQDWFEIEREIHMTLPESKQKACA